MKQKKYLQRIRSSWLLKLSMNVKIILEKKNQGFSLLPDTEGSLSLITDIQAKRKAIKDTNKKS